MVEDEVSVKYIHVEIDDIEKLRAAWFYIIEHRQRLGWTGLTGHKYSRIPGRTGIFGTNPMTAYDEANANDYLKRNFTPYCEIERGFISFQGGGGGGGGGFSPTPEDEVVMFAMKFGKGIVSNDEFNSYEVKHRT